MKEEIKIRIPKDYSAITLKKWLEMEADLRSYEGNDDAIRAVMLYHLCGVDTKWIKSIPIDDYMKINSRLDTFISTTEHPLQTIVTINGTEYGFEPDLSSMPYGMYVDISAYDEIGINGKWAEIMSMLYRPVTKKLGKLYEIKPYSATIDKELFLEVGMDVHFGALFFFKNIQMDLLKSILKSSMEEAEIPHNIRLILEGNGNRTVPLSSLHQMTSSYLMKLKSSH